MTCVAATLYGISGVLEFVGLVVTIGDISAARKRLSTLIGRTRFEYGQVTVRGGDKIVPPPAPSEPRELGERIQGLEEWARLLLQQIETWDKRLVSYLQRDFQNELNAAGKTINHQLDGLREYVEGAQQRWWKSYRGPTLLVLGVLVGTAGNFVALGL
ncbi:hypothetical protein ACFWVB_02935 [Streptomyces microflavus]|uniref:hypothetical protein n=1 Tax=Streptomyces microflavus TaxID=1919 RepID=UPI00365401A6